MTTFTVWDEIDSFVQPGDIIAVKANGFYKLALAAGLMGPYGHIAIIDRIVLDGGNKAMIIQENTGGGAIVPLDFFNNSDFDIIRLTAPDQVATRLVNNALTLLNSMGSYNWSEYAKLIGLGFRRRFCSIFGMKLPTLPIPDPTGGQVCSVFVSNVLITSGVPLTDTMFPSAVVAALPPITASYVMP